MQVGELSKAGIWVKLWGGAEGLLMTFDMLAVVPRGLLNTWPAGAHDALLAPTLPRAPMKDWESKRWDWWWLAAAVVEEVLVLITEERGSIALDGGSVITGEMRVGVCVEEDTVMGAAMCDLR